MAPPKTPPLAPPPRSNRSTLISLVGVREMTHETVADRSDDWHTPAYIFEALGLTFSIDVAAPIEGPKHTPCYNWYHAIDDGLRRKWYGTVWMNPPFGHQRQKIDWLNKFFDHGDGIALFPDRTSAPWWQEAAPKADAILFVNGKIKFIRPDSTIGTQPGTGTTLFACGPRAVAALIQSRLGQVVTPIGNNWK